MAYYLKHTIKKGETMQSIANVILGDVTQWPQLVSLNDLQYPYIVDSNQDKLKNMNHLVTYGDEINIPTLNQLSDLNYNTMNKYTNDSIYDMSMGMDIGLEIPYNDDTEGILSMYADSTHHDIGIVSGEQNLKDSVRRRLLTEYGSLLYHPDYGTKLTQIIGENINDTTVADAKVEILRTIDTDPRVADAEITEFDVSPNGHAGFFCIVSITPQNGEKEFDLYVENANNGSFKVG